MKNLNILVLFLAFLFIGCTKDDKKSHNKTNQLTIDINGTTWKSDSLVHKYSDQVAFSFTYAKGLHIPPNMDNGGLAYDENIILNRIKKEIGRQLFKRRIPGGDPVSAPAYAMFSTWISEGDVPCRTYVVDTTHLEDNWIEIEKEEGGYQKVWGKFNLVLVNDNPGSSCTETNYPDTLRITNTSFYIEY